MMAECRSCKAPIFFARSRVSARLNPINTDSDPSGNITLDPQPDGFPFYDVLTGMLLDQARTEGQTLFLSHFATCPNAAANRNSQPAV